MLRGSGRQFCFGRSCDVSSMFWTSVVQVEQKVDHTRLKKLSAVRVGHFSSKAPTKNIRLQLQGEQFAVTVVLIF